MHKDVIILAGGLGTRLQSVVADTPKCLAPVAGKPFLHYILTALKPYHVCKIVFSVGHLKHQVIDWVQANRQQYGFAVDFAEEAEPLGTGGAIKNALPYTDNDDVIILNGDTLFMADIDELIAFQQQKQADVSIALKPMANFERYGTVVLNQEQEVINFIEKKPQEAGLINGGIYSLYKPSFLSLNMPQKFSFESDYLEKAITHQHHVYGQVHDKYFIDIGIPTDFTRAQVELPQIIANELAGRG
jgi:D-glycero-alpha-D-manno-heptose 1-phosphate guanylyltransferase